MSLKEILAAEVKEIFREKWEKSRGYVVPDPDDLRLGNHGRDLDATVLYADMSDSTGLVNKYQSYFAAEVYKSFLACAARIIRDCGGEITAYDGDRVMAVYLGEGKDDSAVKSALKIKYAVNNIVMPALRAQYPEVTYQLQYTVGIDAGTIRVASIGIRNNRDLVWVGRAANYAAKLCELSPSGGYNTRITGVVYDNLSEFWKISKRAKIWEERSWTDRDNLRIYRTSYHMPF